MCGENEKNTNFSFVLKVNRTNVEYTDHRAKNKYCGDSFSKSIGTDILTFLDFCPRMSIKNNAIFCTIFCIFYKNIFLLRMCGENEKNKKFFFCSQSE